MALSSWRPHLKYIIPGAIFFAFILFSRLWDLDVKPFHHDESMYAVESWKYATKNTYKFHPMFHGPFLYHFQSLLFSVFPINNITARLPVALAGILLPLLGLPILKRFGPASMVTWIGIVAISPTLSYFSRFLGMDTLMIATATGMLWCLLSGFERRNDRYILPAFGLAAILFCTKLNSIFYFFAFASFALPLWLWERDEIHHWRKIAAHLKIPLIGGLILAVIIYVSLFSSLGQNWQGVSDGIFKMIRYWSEQHKLQRIYGPFHYYFIFLAIYELPLALAILWPIHRAATSSRRRSKKTKQWLTVTLACWLLCHWFWPTIGSTFKQLFHFDEAWHPPIALLVIGSWLLLMPYHLARKEKFAAFSFHWLIVSVLLYSYAGEKIPWLLPHMLLPMALYVSVVLPDLIRERIAVQPWRAIVGMLLVVAVGWQATNTVRASMPLSADPRERLVYTHTSWDIVDLAQRIELMGQATGEYKNLNIQATGHAAWPLYWYLRDYNRWFVNNLHPERKSYILIDDWENHDTLSALYGDQYEIERFKLREWWVVDASKATFKNVLRYYFTREPFSILGSQDIAVLIRKDIYSFWR